MALNVPTSSQWVTFPTRPGDVVWVSWQEGRIQKRATYYLTKCYWGNLVKSDLDQSKSNAEAAKTGKKDVTDDGLTKPVVLNSQASLKILGKSTATMELLPDRVTNKVIKGKRNSSSPRNILSLSTVAVRWRTSTSLTLLASQQTSKVGVHDCPSQLWLTNRFPRIGLG